MRLYWETTNLIAISDWLLSLLYGYGKFLAVEEEIENIYAVQL